MTARPAILRPLAEERGATAVEFAIILVPLILLIIGTIDFGRALYTRNNMIEAADVGARVILLDNSATTEAVAGKIRGAFIAGDEDVLDVGMGTATANGIQFRTIDLSYEFDLLTPFLLTDKVTMTHARRVPLD